MTFLRMAVHRINNADPRLGYASGRETVLRSPLQM